MNPSVTQWPAMRAGIALLVLLFAGVVPAAASGTGYVYVLDPAVSCPSGCVGPQVLVFDGGTAQLVTRIPLEKGKIPSGIAISADGAHIYVSHSANMVVIDGRRHTIIANYPLGVGGRLAVRGDDSAVYIRTNTFLWKFDTALHAVTASTTVVSGTGITFDRAIDRIIIPVSDPNDVLRGYASVLDPVSLTEVQQVGPRPAAASMSRSGAELLISRLGFLTRINATSLATIANHPYSVSSAGFVDPADSPSRSAVYLAGRAIGELNTGTGNLTTILLPQTTVATGVAVPPGEKFLFATTARADSTGVTSVMAIDTTTRQVVASYPLDNPPGFNLIASTPEGAPSCTYRLGSGYASFTHTGQVSSAGGTSSPISLTTDCAWQASTADSWVHLSSTSGTGNATPTITVDHNVFPTPRQSRVTIGGQIVTVTQSGGNSNPAFGLIDTPQDFSTGISGSLSVTGWALDDVGVLAVHIYRDPVVGEPPTLIPLGDATLVEGARPDVQAAFPTYPYASRAGWGYMLLTNMLPGGGDGTYRLHVYVEDIEGHQSLLGTRTFTASNSTAALPFGAIDTPGQGQTVSGVITNFGWALTPQPANIPVDGSTIDVIIDGVSVGHPTYGLNRPDIAALFPGYANTNTAVGYFTIDTTTLTNGVHTIAWVVRDSLGRAQGIGSRYFTVQNP